MHPSRIHPPPLNNHPSLAQMDGDEEEDEDDTEQPTRTVRKRSSKACDNCRKAKCKCEKSSDSQACRNCVLLGQECTFLGPSRKRGPPKGYIDAIEARLHQLEALLGTVIASPDPRAQSLVADLITDPLARHIIARVDESPFGSRARDADPKARTHINSARTAILNGQVGFEVPPRDWQDELGARILQSSHSERPSPSSPQRRRLSSSGSVSPAQPRHVSSLPSIGQPSHLPPPDSDAEEPDTLTDALGQLSLNEHHQLRYHGKASGLHILAQAPAFRRASADDTRKVRMDDTGIWKFPSSRVWPPVAAEPSAEESLDLGGDVDEIERRIVEKVLPHRAQQERLIRLYFTYVHPVLPVVHQEVFWRDWEAGARIPTLLLLSLFAVAARYDSSARPPPQAGTMWAAGDRYLEAAKVLLSESFVSVRTLPNHRVLPQLRFDYVSTIYYHISTQSQSYFTPTIIPSDTIPDRSYASSKTSTCQALLLLSYREIGIGAMAQAWLYVGMSVRMAQDLGLHRSIDKWQAAGANTFSAAEKQTRRCIWFGCVVMDKYVSTYIGRPLAVFERDYDTRWPDAEIDEGDAPWVDLVKQEKGETKGCYEPQPGRVLECFAAASKLSAILSHIVEALYSIRPAPGTSRTAERVHLEEELEKWSLNLPVYLRYDVTRGVLESSGQVPPPHVLTLHMMYWCSLLLLHRPSIRFNKPQTARQASPEGSVVSDQSTSTTSTRAIGLCKLAANHITKIVSTYGEHFSLDRGPAFLSYYVFSASIMHVTLLMMNPEDVQAQMGLQECMTALESMNVTWPSAGRAYELLNESKMNIQEHYLESLRHSPWRNKRKTTEELEEERPQGERERPISRATARDDERTMRDGGVQLAPMRDGRPIARVRSDVQLSRLRDGTLANHVQPERSVHSPAPAPGVRMRHVQPSPSQNYGPLPQTYQSQQPVDPMFQDGYTRWSGEMGSYGHGQPEGQGYFGNPGSGWNGMQQQPQGQGWTTSAARFSDGAGRGGQASNAGSGGGYWQDYQSAATFGNDMSSSLYGIMPPVGHVPGEVGMQTIFQDGASYGAPDGPNNYPVYSRLS